MMIATDYEKQATDFLTGAGITFEVVKATNQSCPNWGNCEAFRFTQGKRAVMVPHNHGFKYTVTFKRNGKEFVLDFWSSINDTYGKDVKVYVEDLLNNNLHSANANFDSWLAVHNSRNNAVKPTAYGVLACISGDTNAHESTFQEFCDNYGYDNDSIKAKGSYEAVSDQSRKMARFFTATELEALQEIQ